MMSTLLLYVGAAIAEIAGCFAFWAHVRLERGPWWIAVGLVSLALFAWLLTFSESAFAGRAFAAYGGVYIVCALMWLRLAEGVRLDRWDLVGAALCLIGAAVIVAAPRPAG